MGIIIDVLIIILVLAVSRRVSNLKKAIDKDRLMFLLLLKDNLKIKIVEMKKDLENLMNIKTDVKKKNTNSKTK